MMIQQTEKELRFRSLQRFRRAAQDLREHRRQAQTRALLAGSAIVVLVILILIGARLLIYKSL